VPSDRLHVLDLGVLAPKINVTQLKMPTGVLLRKRTLSAVQKASQKTPVQGVVSPNETQNLAGESSLLQTKLRHVIKEGINNSLVRKRVVALNSN
jgi:hypothetical protein